MPITQDRLLRIIEAGEHFQATSLTLRHFFNLKCREVASGQLSIISAFTEITNEFNLAVPADSIHSSTLMGERVRYNITHKRNSIEKRRIYNRRHSPGSAPGSTQPRLSPSATLAAINSRFPGATDDTDLDLDVPTPADIHAAIDRAISESSSKK